MEKYFVKFDERMLLTILDEVVPFESLIDRFSSEPEDFPTSRTPETMLRYRLLGAISRGLICACLLHTEPPFLTPVHPTFETLPRYWFYCTLQGEMALRAANRRRPDISDQEHDIDQETPVPQRGLRCRSSN
jgi:hypothetical protein